MNTIPSLCRIAFAACAVVAAHGAQAANAMRQSDGIVFIVVS